MRPRSVWETQQNMQNVIEFLEYIEINDRKRNSMPLLEMNR